MEMERLAHCCGVVSMLKEKAFDIGREERRDSEERKRKRGVKEVKRKCVVDDGDGDDDGARGDKVAPELELLDFIFMTVTVTVRE